MIYDDLIKSVCYKNLGISEIFGKLIKDLLVVHRVILSHKENLLVCTKRVNYPSILCALASQHADFPEKWYMLRVKVNGCLQKVVELFDEMKMLKLMKVWDITLFSDRIVSILGIT